MTYTGHFSNGYVKLDDGVRLPEGTPVRVEILSGDLADEVAETTGDSSASDKDSDPDGDELVALLLRYAGQAKDLPPDLAANHDHYIHGKPLE
jgi:hypothetical protein